VDHCIVGSLIYWKYRKYY